MSCIETPYQTPDGYYDSPFMFITNCNGLTNGQSYTNLTQPMDGTPFILRRVCGLNNTAGFFQYYNNSLSQVFSDQAIIPNRDAQFGVLPEKQYDGNGQIRFDLGTVAKATLSSGDEIAYVGWQGVKRLRGNPTYPTLPKGIWKGEPQTYAINIGPIDWTNQASPRRFQININRTDFILFRITQVETAEAGIVAEGEPVTGLVAYRLYDYSGQRALSNAPVPDFLCVDTTVDQDTGIYAQQNQCPFPVPGIVYPVGGHITFDLAALRQGAVSDSIQIAFHGMNRSDCGS